MTHFYIPESTTIYQPPRPQTVQVNKTAFMYCQASFNRNKLDLIYMWSFNGRVIDIERNEHFRRVRHYCVANMRLISRDNAESISD